MNNDCIICFEPVSKLDEHKPECDCKYTAHTQCITKWNNKCVICNKLTIVSSMRERILDRILVCLFTFVVLCGVYVISKYGEVST